MLETIKLLCEINAPSGAEEPIRKAIIKQISGFAEYSTDALGNLIVFKKGKQEAKNKVMLAAHMDEVGFIVRYVEDSGLLRFACVGGIDTRVIVGKRLLVGEKAVTGVIGTKPIHLTKGDERETMPDIDSLYIDIGAKDKEDALKYISPGDYAVFESGFVNFGNNLIKAKALDDRAGCAVLIEMIRSELTYDTWFTFNVQEEVGCRGAMVSAFTVAPDYAIVLEATTAADIAGVEAGKQVCELGKGPVVSFMDRGTVYDRELYHMAFELAEKAGIHCQPKQMVAGSNEASAIHKVRGGIKTLAISMPCRYIHSPSCVLKTEDISDTFILAKAAAEHLAQL
ncbi:M42 family metallopeptidase [Acetanaerobacterium elongatum]|uniref:Endoglucanase n=1 Tax=Acetanaerobacterium elongatum TaxID=258515 RepID=A0A1G9YR33_9FIRM|nr:M42 family metallopeptidase [Acetanaerobacterium elongatum]SDN11614.1 endoglucanase [Acetanaerobacterium elongatum]